MKNNPSLPSMHWDVAERDRRISLSGQPTRTITALVIYVCLSLYHGICPSVCQSVCEYFSVYFCLSVSVSVRLSLYLSLLLFNNTTDDKYPQEVQSVEQEPRWGLNS